jgi:hypothetical protein
MIKLDQARKELKMPGSLVNQSKEERERGRIGYLDRQI